MTEVNQSLTKHSLELFNFRNDSCLENFCSLNVPAEKLSVEHVLKIKEMSLLHKSEIMTLLTSINGLIDKCDYFLQNKCNHDWIPDRATYDPCRTYYMCSRCQFH
jgi:hypothetical protein